MLQDTPTPSLGNPAKVTWQLINSRTNLIIVLSSYITSRPILTSREPPSRPTKQPPTAYIRSILPHELGKVSGSLTESLLAEVVFVPFVSPGFHDRRGVRVPYGDVLAKGAAGVSEFASATLIVEVVRCKGR